jgi:hypothetical protein
MIPKEVLKKLTTQYGKNIIKSTDNHYRIEIQTESKRSQVVELIYKEKKSDDIDYSRYIAVSPIGPIFRSFNYEEILKLNSKISIGAVCIDEFQNREGIHIPYLAVRATHIAFTADFEEIIELIIEVGKLADKLEKDVYGKDIF